MPYINKNDRDQLNKIITELVVNLPSSPDHGETKIGYVNYVITQILLQVAALDGVCDYDAYNRYIGVLECAKLEFYRRAVADYEDKKKAENGDVY